MISFRPVSFFRLREFLVGQPGFVLCFRGRLGNGLLNALRKVFRPLEQIGCRIFIFAMGGDQFPSESLVHANGYFVTDHRFLIHRWRCLRTAASQRKSGNRPKEHRDEAGVTTISIRLKRILHYSESMQDARHPRGNR